MHYQALTDLTDMVTEASASTIRLATTWVIAVLNTGEVEIVRLLCWLAMMHVRQSSHCLLRFHRFRSSLICLIVAPKATTR